MDSFTVELEVKDLVREAQVTGGIAGFLMGVGVTSAIVAISARRHLEKTYPDEYRRFLTRK